MYFQMLVLIVETCACQGISVLPIKRCVYESNRMQCLYLNSSSANLSLFLSDANMPVSGKHYGLHIARAFSLNRQTAELYFPNRTQKVFKDLFHIVV